jgi:hypothetical protein
MYGGREPGVLMVNAHDPLLLEQAQRAGGGRHARRA